MPTDFIGWIRYTPRNDWIVACSHSDWRSCAELLDLQIINLAAEFPDPLKLPISGVVLPQGEHPRQLTNRRRS